ncbi:hypothetical protein GW17_00059946 [Ensete ventricosum]|nr:hypothetical protein GW17_00059946 [Ensete ventricosum]
MLISGFLLYNLSLASTAATLHHRILSYYFSRTLPLFVPRRSVSSVVASYPLLSSRCGSKRCLSCLVIFPDLFAAYHYH